MTYLEFKTTVGDLNSGATVPDSIDIITKLVLGKIARLRLSKRIKTKEITVAGNTEWVLSTEIPDFLGFKLDAENNNRCIYYYQSTTPYFLILTNPSRFVQNIEGGYAAIIDGKLKINLPEGITSPDTLYVPYYSKYLVLDGTTEKEKPIKDGDTFLLDSVFDDALVEGVLLYIKRRSLNDYEFAKAVKEWNQSIASLALYQ